MIFDIITSLIIYFTKILFSINIRDKGICLSSKIVLSIKKIACLDFPLSNDYLQMKMSKMWSRKKHQLLQSR